MTDIKAEVQSVLNNSKVALLGIVGDAEPKVIAAVATYVGNLEGRATVLLEYMAADTSEDTSDKITFLIARLKDEKNILESEFLSFVVMGKQIAQDAINAITTILVTAIGEVLPAQP